jgi:uridylate kinase
MTSPTNSTPAAPRYKRVLLKLSGESFARPGGFGIDPECLSAIAREVKEAATVGTQVAVVVGGGNIIRGATLAAAGHIAQATADQMGMLGTVINGIALKEALIAQGLDTRVQSAVEMKSVAEPFIRGRAIRHLEKGRVVILAAGTGNPFFTTDTCAALRAAELRCEVILKATKVDGVYTADPKKDPKATRYESLSFAEAISKNLKVMDTAAFALCQEQKIPVIIFNFDAPGNIRRVVQGDSIGTLVHA